MINRLLPAALLVLATLCFGGISPGAQAQITIMPLGDSGTVGVDYYTNTSGGYRDPLYSDLVTSGISFTFVGATNTSPTPQLTAAGDTYHNGYGFYKIDDILDNLNGNTQPNPGDGNQGGYWLTGGNGTGRAAVYPDITLLEIGANDIIYQSDPQTTNPTQAQFLADMEGRLYTLVTTIHSLTYSANPNAVILVAAIYPFNNSATFDSEIQAYNAYIKNTLVPALSYTRCVDNYSAFLNADGSVNGLLLGTDNVHPTRYGYPVWALDWAPAIRALENSNPATYKLTVNSGTGSGSYPAGSVVTVNSATPPAGDQFAGWSPATTALDNPFYWPIATYIMPAAPANLTATYDTSGSPIIPNGTYNIVSKFYDGLSVASNGSTAGSPVQQQTYTGATTQQWQVMNLGNNAVKLSLPGTNNALGVVGASTTAGAYLDIEAYTGATSQQWTLTSVLGTLEIVNVNSGMAVNINGYQTQPGIQLVQSPAGYIVNQIWSFFPTNVPNLQSVGSVQLHAGTPYSIPLPPAGNPGVECRAINGSLKLVFTFDRAVTSGSAAVTAGTGSVSGNPTFSGDTMTVNLTGVADAQSLTVEAANLNATQMAVYISFDVLLGDVNGDGAVNSQDLVAVRNAVGAVSGGTGFNPADDLNEDGAVNSQDLVEVRNRVGDHYP
jgi:hypothetical protein